MSPRVLLVDDDPLVLSALRLLLAGDPTIDVVGQASDGEEALSAVRRHHPDVVLMDVRMPRLDGIGALRALRAASDSPPAVLVLTTFGAEGVVLDALRSGAVGFLLKHTAPEQIVAAIHAAATGQPVVSEVVLQQLIERVADESPRDRPDRLAALSEREREVAVGVADGLSNAEIAARLHLSTGSVKAHLSSALSKLGLENRVQLAIAAHDSR